MAEIQLYSEKCTRWYFIILLSKKRRLVSKTGVIMYIKKILIKITLNIFVYQISVRFYETDCILIFVIKLKHNMKIFSLNSRSLLRQLLDRKILQNTFAASKLEGAGTLFWNTLVYLTFQPLKKKLYRSLSYKKCHTRHNDRKGY